MKTVVCFIASLSSGGAEHQLVELTKLLSDYFNVTIATFVDVEDHYVIDNRVKRIRLGMGKNKFWKALGVFSFFFENKSRLCT